MFVWLTGRIRDAVSGVVQAMAFPAVKLSRLLGDDYAGRRLRVEVAVERITARRQGAYEHRKLRLSRNDFFAIQFVAFELFSRRILVIEEQSDLFLGGNANLRREEAVIADDQRVLEVGGENDSWQQGKAKKQAAHGSLLGKDYNMIMIPIRISKRFR
jgi:hypothetical protein